VRCLALLTILVLAIGLGACGSSDEPSADIPRTSPDLTIPTATSAALPSQASATTTSTTATSTAPAAPPAASSSAPPPAAPPPPAPQGSSTTGGQAPTQGQGQGQGQSTTGGAQAGGGEFDNFCAQNPGACP
jgi:hypothetical protein